MKTQTLLLLAIHTLLEHRQPVLILEPSYSLITTICYPRITEMLVKIGIPHQLNKSEAICRTPYGDIYFRSANQPEKIIGIEVIGVFWDECDLCSMEQAETLFYKASARIRLHSKNPKYKGQNKGIMRIASTPEGYNFLWKNWYDTPIPDSELIRMTTYSNPHLPDGYIQSLEAQYPKNLLDAYLGGLFVNLQKLSVYYVFSRQDHVVKQTAPSKTETLYIGMDFNVGQMACAIFVERKNSQDEIVWLLIDEIAQGRDTADVIAKLRDRYPRNEIIVYPDASGSRTQTSSMSRSDHTMLRQSGFTVKVNSINPRIKDRIISVNNAFEKQKLFVSAGCKRSIDALEQQAYDKDGFPEKTNSEHLASAIGYFVAYEMPVATAEVRYRAIQLL